ncbi:Gfo/Idh/MocA family oxidoreductase [Caldifermentibacillus hisashii]|uniref:Gfo/Idh/MocA family oxidoreductase n=1 Tax=Bacillaceae TaxID=186817 RepID=UPI000BA35325|nr:MULTISPECIES: Gfo/Idh/MocA family oxidoreductase [Bacillaceae]MCB7071081.1 Gfo/Idh/MocA family oxidoreductase [Caldibacillus sp. 210928-DFI.2.22]MCB7073578.1 Gfo/Idh/MocA family oxidoreductase [Caldibacillus sp. 210928-DFI.2.18]MCM3799453.1 Gfo/Idh/MocA family oxidoreductase [Caldibacillus thermoamylovorans]PAC36774.1 dehydrogenase [Caldifermentibacillus hisashii]
MTTRTYNLAVVGYGGMGSYHVDHLLKSNPQIHVKGIFDIKQERNDVALSKGLQVYECLDALLSDKSIHIVLIATPNDVHKEIAIKALKAHKHVVCEKPVTIYARDLEEIMTVAEETGQVFMVHQNRRWDEDFLTVKKIYNEKMTGEIFHIESRVHGANGIPGDWRHLKKNGGGMVLDWGVHLLDQLLFMIHSPVTSVYANLSYVLGDEVDDGFQTYLTFANGITALVEVGTTNFISLPRWYLKGTEGTAIIEDWGLNGKIVKQNKDIIASAPKPIKAGQGLTKTMAPPSEEATTMVNLPAASVLSQDFYDNLVSVIEGRTEAIVKNHEVLRVLKLMEIIFESAEKNEVVKTSL